MNISSRPTDRVFGFSLAMAVLLVTGIRWYIKGYVSTRLLALALALVVISIFMPSLLLPLNRGMQVLIHGLLRITNWIVLAVAYWVFVTPVAYFSRASGRAKHFRNWKEASRDSYFSKVTRQDDMTTMKDMF